MQAGYRYVFLLLAFGSMLLLWNDDSPYWQVGLAYVFIGIGVGFAGTPASHSLTGSVPVQRAGMASGTADLQIVDAAKSSFLSGADWAYTAGIIAILIGAVIVFFLFPRKEQEQQLLAAYQAEDVRHRREGRSSA